MLLPSDASASHLREPVSYSDQYQRPYVSYYFWLTIETANRKVDSLLGWVKHHNRDFSVRGLLVVIVR